MTIPCPISSWQDCGGQFPCAVCRHNTTLPTRATVADTVWCYSPRLGWHEPAEGCPAVQAGVESSVKLGSRGSDMTESEALDTPRTPESTDPTRPEGTPYG